MKETFLFDLRTVAFLIYNPYSVNRESDKIPSEFIEAPDSMCPIADVTGEILQKQKENLRKK